MASPVVIVDYKMGNLASVANMLKRAGFPSQITSDPKVIEGAERIILPGVGAFGRAMHNITSLGLREVLDEKALREGVPILGVCLGMQLLTQGSEESDGPGLGWIDGTTVRFRFDSTTTRLKIPHMGWNLVKPAKDGGLLAGTGEEPRFYFVHSFHVECNDASDVVGYTNHGYDFVSVLQRDNIHGAQFHPEKSHRFGMQLFRNFVALA